ncbi:hypothetical protein [Pseudoalteromonas sp. Z9A6]|uniref:hypothetical protein n=1 Tax=Pseudoalteromonas sp. Z9A6 TaxID=2686352 RepID=UPI0013FDCBCB|nr:hypothetical protein [Pseudoalteromonas sp. Z9A6]
MKNTIPLLALSSLLLTACSPFNGSPEQVIDTFNSAAKAGDVKTAFSVVYDPKGRKTRKMANWSESKLQNAGKMLQKIHEQKTGNMTLNEKTCYLDAETIEAEGLPKEWGGACMYEYTLNDGSVKTIDFVYENDKWAMSFPF